ncbi:Transposase [Bacteroidales bacterium Barb6XT]|nr:Transposase [Bacteroidales bacterium Barb6XT]
MEKKCFHKLSDILLTGLLTCLSHGEDYEDMVLSGNTRERFLKEMIPPANGIPSHDTFNRVFSGLEPDLLCECLNNYGRDLIGLLSEKQICLDGRKLKGVSPGSRGNTGLYIVNARVAENRLCTGRKRADDKSNEITAVPCLIEEPDIEDAVAGIDALGCQRDTAGRIVEKKGHCLLALKQNQPDLPDDASCGFRACPPESVCEEWEYDHGRYETRKCSIMKAKDAVPEENMNSRPGLRTPVKVEASGMIKDRQSKEIRYCISDEEGMNASCFNAPVRGHWGIENQLHRHLDVTFREDACRARKGHAAENLSTMRKPALQIIKEQPDKLSLKKRRLNAAYNIEYLKKLIT